MLAAQRIRTMVLLLIQKNGFATSHRDFYKIMEVTFAAACLYGVCVLVLALFFLVVSNEI